MSTTQVVGLLVVIAALSSVVGFLYCLYRWHPVLRFHSLPARQLRKDRIVLLYQTDHRALWEACQKLSARVGKGELKPGAYNVKIFPAPESRSFPRPVLDLHPDRVWIEPDGRVIIAMQDELLRFGASYCPEGSHPPPDSVRELAPGLWYYDSGYRKYPRDWARWLEAIGPAPADRGFGTFSGRILRRPSLRLVDAISLVQRILHGIGYFFGIIVFTWLVSRDVKRDRHRLLYQTDHQALLEACRELTNRVARGDLKPGKYRILVEPSPEAAAFPRVILNLRPSNVTLFEGGEVMVAMAGYLDLFGVRAYPEDSQNRRRDVREGERELVPGLWYYDDSSKAASNTRDRHHDVRADNGDRHY